MSNDLADALGLKYPSFFWVIDSRFFCIIDSRFFCSRYCCIAFGEMGYRGLLQAKPGGKKRLRFHSSQGHYLFWQMEGNCSFWIEHYSSQNPLSFFFVVCCFLFFFKDSAMALCAFKLWFVHYFPFLLISFILLDVHSPKLAEYLTDEIENSGHDTLQNYESGHIWIEAGVF